MAVKYRQGDIFDDLDQLDVIPHQTNTLGVFGAGFAKKVKQKFPEVDRAQRELYRQGGQKLGVVQVVPTHISGLFFANMYAQSSVTRLPGRVNTNYNALRTCLEKLKELVPVEQVIGMPQIGSGLGGGKWSEIERMLNEVFTDRTVYVYIYKR